MPWGTAGLDVLGSLEGKLTGYKEEEGESFMGSVICCGEKRYL